MKAQNWPFAGAVIVTLMLAGWTAEGQVETNSGRRAEDVYRSCSGTALARPSETNRPGQKVLANEIGKRIQIIGRLGHPL
jgi:hypothetical protein